jgi:nitrous oxide reductase accessory protein NosL
MKRRRLIQHAATAGTVGLAGCLSVFGSDESQAPEPVDLSGGKFDDQGGMEIGPHGGANGQLFYEHQTPPERESGPFWFHTLVYGFFPFYFDRQNRGWETTATYVTDFSAVDYEVQSRDGTPTMPSLTAPDTFGEARELTYVMGSSVHGGMGPDLHPFSDEQEAEAFVSDHGGETITFDDITPTVVEQIRGSQSMSQ